LGADETKPDGRSFFVYPDGTWKTYAEVNKAVTKSNKDGDLMIRVTVDQPRIQITVQAEPKIGPISVDGVSYSADRLPVTSTWEIGSAHTLSVDSTISGEEGVRYVFVEWSDGSKDTSHTITVTETASLTAKFKTQYELKVTSDLGDPQGSGWYDAGSTATFSVTSPQPETGLFGSLGGKTIFRAWTGDSTADKSTADIVMDGPKTVRAQWITDDSQPYMILGGIGVGVVIVIILALLLMRRKKLPSPVYPPAQAPAPPPPPPPHAQVPFCKNCGRPTAYIAQYQRYYCYNCQQYD